MHRIVRWVGVCLLLVSAPDVPAQEPATRQDKLQGQAQQPVAAEPQASSQTVQTPRELVPTLPVPRLVKFAGTLQDEQGKPRTGVVGVTFAIYKDQEGGAAQWLETQNVQLDEQGHYTVLLGSTKSEGLPLELFSAGEPRWLGVQVNLPKELEHPRVLLVSVPYALKAADADTLGGRPLSSFVLNDAATPGGQKEPTSKKGQTTLQTGAGCSGITSDGTATTNSIALFSSTCNIEGSLMTQTLVNGFPGVNLAGNNTGLLLSGTGSHEVGMTSTTTGVSGRLGQDSDGFFFASDTNGKAVRFYTNNGTLNEGLRITSAGNVGIGTTTPAAALDVNGNFNARGTVGGSQLISNVPTGTPPLSVTSTTVVPNLNASMLGGLMPGDYAQLGAANVFGQTLSVNAANPIVGALNATSPYQAIVGTMTSNDFFTAAVTGNATATGQGTTFGVAGSSATSSGYGVYGTNPNGIGVAGYSSSGGTGVYAHNNALGQAALIAQNDGGGPAANFTGDLQLTGKFITYNNTFTYGNGVPTIVSVFQNSSSGSGATGLNLYTPSGDGVFRLILFQECTTTSGGGTIFAPSFGWTLPTGGPGAYGGIGGPDCSSLNQFTETFVLHVKGGTTIQWEYPGMNASFQNLILIEQLM